MQGQALVDTLEQMDSADGVCRFPTSDLPDSDGHFARASNLADGVCQISPPRSRSVFAIDQSRQAVEGDDKARVVEWGVGPEDLPDLRQDNGRNESLRLGFRVALPYQPLEGFPGFRRILFAQLVLDDLQRGCEHSLACGFRHWEISIPRDVIATS